MGQAEGEEVICGHIHYATIHDEHGIRYMNCGDWVESCTALAEHEDGTFEIITWTDPQRRIAPLRRLPPAPLDLGAIGGLPGLDRAR
jgi:hypothetical protein